MSIVNSKHKQYKENNMEETNKIDESVLSASTPQMQEVADKV